MTEEYYIKEVGGKKHLFKKGIGRRIQRISEAIEAHEHWKELAYLCILANDLKAALSPLKEYAQSRGQEVIVIQSASKIPSALRPNTHIVVDITAGKDWLPSKALLKAKWGDVLMITSQGSVVGITYSQQLASTQGKATTFATLVVPKNCYLHFYCDKPFNPPQYFAERFMGRVLDFRTSDFFGEIRALERAPRRE
jgi:hypothetical protein